MERKLTDKQIKGIDLSVRALKKVFPFVKGWEFNEGWEKYEVHLYLDLYINTSKLSEMFDMEIKEYFINKSKDGEVVKSSAILAPFNWGDFKSEEWEKISDSSHQLRMKLNDTLKKAYDYIPDDMKVYWKTNYSTYPVTLDVDGFIFEF